MTHAAIKENIRRNISETGRVSQEDKKHLDSLIVNRLFNSDILNTADIVMAYISMDDEVDTAPIIERLAADGKTVLVPVIKEGSIRPVVFKKPYKTVKGRFREYIPENGSFLTFSNTEDIKAVLVPGMAFSTAGARLGRGKGFYDRFLAGLSQTTRKIGITYEFRLTEGIPMLREDIFMDMIITESGIYRRSV